MAGDALGPTWDIVAVAPELSGLAGVIAGFSFGGVTLLLSRPHESSRQPSSIYRACIGQLGIASLLLGIAALQWALIAGDVSNLLRAEASAAFAAVTLLVGMLQTAVGLCGLLVDNEQQVSGGAVTVTFRHTCRIGFLAVGALATFTLSWITIDVIWLGFNDWPRQSGMWAGRLIPLGLAVIVVLALLSRRTRQRSRPETNWARVGVVTIGASTGFAMTITSADDSQLATAGEWTFNPSVFAYIVVLIAVALGAVRVVIWEGRMVESWAARLDEQFEGPFSPDNGP